MKRFLFAAALAAAFCSASQVQAQTTKKTTKPANTSVAPAASTSSDNWGWSDAATTPAAATGWEGTGAETTTAPAVDPMMQSSGVMLAPGMNTAPYRGTSTDYHGRPVAKPRSKRPRSVEVAQNDPMMQSSGVMLAPGMNTAPYRGVSTDYHGRPLRKPVATTVAAPTADNSTMAAGW
jgi:hypothetical protein